MEVSKREKLGPNIIITSSSLCSFAVPWFTDKKEKLSTAKHVSQVLPFGKWQDASPACPAAAPLACLLCPMASVFDLETLSLSSPKSLKC